MIFDDERIFVGIMNFDFCLFDLNIEMGVLIESEKFSCFLVYWVDM